MQLTVLCLLAVATCAYAQIGFDITKNFGIDLPFFSANVSKSFGAGIGRRRRDVSPNDPPEDARPPGRGPRIENGGRFKPRPEDGPPVEIEANGPRSQHRPLGLGAPGHLFPHPLPLRPHHGHHGRRSTTTEPASSSEASNEDSNEESNESSSEANSESSSNASSEDSGESSSQSNN